MKPCEEVIRLQEMLRDLGYYSGNIRSGTFGALTGKAVARFQKENGLKATEIADPETIEAIEAEWDKLSL
ncbi:MAG: peptidoglycan-binding protein [Clostridia bacterium]|nr:peptidoglycan-binding protein [Clostridia bacterium]